MNGLCVLFLFAAIVTANTQSSDETCTDNPECPVPDGEYVTQLPYEPDCHKFYKCSNGKACIISCPEYQGGKLLVYNPDTQTCDWPWNVPDAKNCDNASSPSSPTQPTSTSTTPNPNPTPGKCPSTGTVNIPDPNNCRYYYECNDGIPTHRRCMVNNVFNPTVGMCDLASNVPSCKP